MCPACDRTHRCMSKNSIAQFTAKSLERRLWLQMTGRSQHSHPKFLVYFCTVGRSGAATSIFIKVNDMHFML